MAPEVSDVLEQSLETMTSVLASYYKAVDMTEIAKTMAKGELIEAYIATLNMEADYLGQGGARSSNEYKEIKSMLQMCEHWIAQRVLRLSGCGKQNVTRYYKREG